MYLFCSRMLLVFVLAGCREPARTADGSLAPAPGAAVGAASGAGGAAPAAVARLQPVGSGSATGAVRLTRYAAGVRVLAEVEGLSADGFHALHVLTARSCDEAEGAPLFDPDRASHGSPYEGWGRRKAGGLGNLQSDDEGRARYDRFDPVLTLDGPRSAVGRAVVVRERQDDFVAEPAGGAGAPLACGVLEPTR